MAGFQRFPRLTEPISDAWATQVVPVPQYAQGLMYDPTRSDWNPQVSPYRMPDAGFTGTGFADYIQRNMDTLPGVTSVPMTYRPPQQPTQRAPFSLSDLFMWWRNAR